MRCGASEARSRVLFFDSDSSVHIQDGGKGENASHKLFHVFALLFFCMRHLADSVQLQVSSVGRTLFKLAVKTSSMYKKHSTHTECVERMMCNGDSILSCMSVTFAFTLCVVSNNQ